MGKYVIYGEVSRELIDDEPAFKAYLGFMLHNRMTESGFHPVSEVRWDWSKNYLSSVNIKPPWWRFWNRKTIDLDRWCVRGVVDVQEEAPEET